MKHAEAAITLCILAASASCGGKSDDGVDDPLPLEPRPVSPRDDGEALPRVDTLPIPAKAPETASVNDMVLGILDGHCGSCHGRSSEADPSVAPSPLEFTDDIDRMVALGIIVPLNGASSPLVQVMVDGSMPPPESEPRPSESDIIAIRQFIDNPRLWPEPPPEE